MSAVNTSAAAAAPIVTVPQAVANSTAQPPTPALPTLREELVLLPGPHNADGSPTWLLHDPPANRFYRLGWVEFEILSRWSLGSADAIVAAIGANSLLRPTTADVDEVLQFLLTHNLVIARGSTALARLAQMAEQASRRNVWWLLKNYLFLRFPLLRPDRFLDATLPAVRWLGSRGFLLLSLLVGLLGVALVSRQWDVFLATFGYFFSVQGLFWAGLAIAAAKVVHEFAHAYVCKAQGCRVPSMGLAFLVLWPVLYTDASDAWKLRERQARLRIGAAGMLAEIVLAAYATLLWVFLPDGPVRSAVFLLATTTWILTLLINLNPFLRFDGYYLLSDLLRVPNLQARAFALARWRLREWLFGYGEPAPEYVPSRLRRVLLVYAYATWVYRFFLFLAIAVLVYLLFFKLLGLLLMVAELAWFIGRPIWLELREWASRRARLRLNRATLRTSVLLSAVLLVLIVPWKGGVTAPGYWRAEQQLRLYAPVAAQVDAVEVRPGSHVSTGQPLLLLSAPDLRHALDQGQRRIDSLRWQMAYQSVSADLQARVQVLDTELRGETAALAARAREHDQLTLSSGLDGRVAELLQPLRAGDWLAEGDWLMTLVAPEQGVVEAWVSEADLPRLRHDERARFYPADRQRTVIDLQLLRVDENATTTFSEPYLLSMFGGPIATRETSDGRWVPEVSVYRVLLVPVGESAAPSRITAGRVWLAVEPESLLMAAWRTVSGVVIRESGF